MVYGRWLYYFWILSLIYPSAFSSSLHPDEQQLFYKLFNEQAYDNSVRPVFNSSHNVEVTFGFTLIQIMDMVRFSFLFLFHYVHTFSHGKPFSRIIQTFNLPMERNTLKTFLEREKMMIVRISLFSSNVLHYFRINLTV